MKSVATNSDLYSSRKSISAKRKTFVCREDLIESLSYIAKKRGHSLYGTVNDLFELALTAEALSLNLKKVVEERQVEANAKRLGLTLGPENLWYEMADIAYKEKKEVTLKSWHDAGVWFAKRYILSDVENPYENLMKDLSDLSVLFWNVPEMQINRVGSHLSVRVLSPRFSDSYTHLLGSFIKGAVETFMYKLVYLEINRGIIRMEIIKE